MLALAMFTNAQASRANYYEVRAAEPAHLDPWHTEVCFDQDPYWEFDQKWGKHAGTDCKICVWTDGNAKACRKGLHVARNPDGLNCIELKGVQQAVKDGKTIKMTTDCDDGMWIDRIEVYDRAKGNTIVGCPGAYSHQRCGVPNGRDSFNTMEIGSDNEEGWCMSTDNYDFRVFEQWKYTRVTKNRCYTLLHINTKDGIIEDPFNLPSLTGPSANKWDFWSMMGNGVLGNFGSRLGRRRTAPAEAELPAPAEAEITTVLEEEDDVASATRRQRRAEGLAYRLETAGLEAEEEE